MQLLLALAVPLSCLGNSTQAGVRSPPVSFKSAWLLKLIFWRTFVACNCSGASARDQFRYLRKINFRVQLWVEISVFFFRVPAQASHFCARCGAKNIEFWVPIFGTENGPIFGAENGAIFGVKIYF